MGDLGVEKEWTFAGETVEAMWTLVQQDEIFEANLGSGIAHSIADWANACFMVVHCDWREYVIQKELFTPEYSRLVANPARIQALGWRPKISLPQLAHMMVLDKPDET